jgi:hypothetical protein
MRLSATLSRISIVVLVAFCGLASAFGATETKLSDDALAPLRGSLVAKKMRLEKLPLYDSRRSVIDLEEFQVWAPDGKVLIHDGRGGVKTLVPPAMRFFRGRVNGDPESFAYFSMELGTGKIDGLVATRDDNFAVEARPWRPSDPRRNRTLDPGSSGAAGFDYFLTSTNADDMNTAPAPGFQCDLDEHRMTPPTLRRMQTDAHGLPIQSQALTGSQHYSIRLEVETDDELYANAGNNVFSETTYITNLIGAMSTIYNRDLLTDVVLGTVHIHSGGPGTDQWTATTSGAGLDELGTYYHNNPGYSGGPHSAVTMLSGKSYPGGIAWEGIICGADFPNGGNWGGAYSWCGLIGTSPSGPFGSIPNPDATTNGALYGMPTGQQNYWPLAEVAHEVGHNFAGHHTHCVAISDAERTAAGFTDGSPANSTSNFVDHCYASEGGACFSGTNYVLGSQTTFRGTIMSYCHNTFNGSVPQSRFTFGQASEPSHHELDDYMLRSPGPISGFANIVSATTASLSAITAPSSVTANSTGNTASVTNVGGQTYSWSITNGTITSSSTTNAITYTAGASGTVTVKVATYGANNCGITDSKAITINSVTYNPPTNVVATATGSTTVSVTWTAATGTAPGRYNVYRSSDGINYGASIGNTMTTAFTDTTAAANTAYLYKVRSADSGGGNESADSNRDVATTVVYTNPTLTAGVSPIQRIDLIELRTAVDKVRALNGIGAGLYATDSTITAGVTTLKKAHIDELRTNLNTPLNNMGLPLPTYTNATLVAGSSLVTAVDFNELRAAMR